MERTMCAALAEHVGQEVILKGWLAARRPVGKIEFLVVRDRSGPAQVVAGKGSAPRAGPESVLAVRGRVVANEQAPGGAELIDPQIEVLALVEGALPVAPGPAGRDAPLPRVLDHAPVALRDSTRREPFEVAAHVTARFRDTLGRLGFTEVYTPKIVAGATETGANVFALDYFGQPAYLAQSPQLYKQIMVGVFERVFEVGPVFRAEPHATVRHLAQYVSLDVELGFIEDHRDVITVLGELLHGMLAGLAVPAPALELPLPQITFEEALRIAGADEGSPDLAPADERAVGEWARQRGGGDFVVVTGYPMAKRPFYTHPDPARPARSNSFDLLFRGTELVTGGQRLHRADELHAAVAAHGIDPDSLGGYLEAFECGMPPHGGFAIGLERFVAGLCGLKNIREATLFPRDRNRLSP